jgi:hypothetical protein
MTLISKHHRLRTACALFAPAALSLERFLAQVPFSPPRPHHNSYTRAFYGMYCISMHWRSVSFGPMVCSELALQTVFSRVPLHTLDLEYVNTDNKLSEFVISYLARDSGLSKRTREFNYVGAYKQGRAECMRLVITNFDIC